MSSLQPSPALTRAFCVVVRPLVRLLVSRGLTLQSAVELLKRAYVEVAVNDLGISEGELTDSRICLLTGVHRAEVKRLRALGSEQTSLPKGLSMGAQVVSRWLTEAGWQDPEGRPLAIPRLASKGGSHSFDALVAGVSRDIRARPLLDEWLRLGIVEIDAEDRVSLVTEGFVPSYGVDEKLAYLALNVGDHARAATANVLGEGEPWFERSLHYVGLTPEQVSEVRAAAADAGQQALLRINRMVGDQPSEASSDANQRFTFGAYFYAEPIAPGDAASADQGLPQSTGRALQ